MEKIMAFRTCHGFFLGEKKQAAAKCAVHESVCAGLLLLTGGCPK